MTNKISFEAGKIALRAAAVLIAIISFLYGLANFNVVPWPTGVTIEVLILGMALVLLAAETIERFQKQNPLNWISVGVLVLGGISVIGTLFGYPVHALDPFRGLILLITAFMLIAELFTNIMDQ